MECVTCRLNLDATQPYLQSRSEQPPRYSSTLFSVLGIGLFVPEMRQIFVFRLTFPLWTNLLEIVSFNKSWDRQGVGGASR